MKPAINPRLAQIVLTVAYTAVVVFVELAQRGSLPFAVDTTLLHSIQMLFAVLVGKEALRRRTDYAPEEIETLLRRANGGSDSGPA